MVSAPRDVVPAKHGRYEQLISAAQKHPPIKVAVVHPCDTASMGGVSAATRLRLIEAMLVGPVERLRTRLSRLGCSLRTLRSSARPTVTIRPPEPPRWSLRAGQTP